MLHNTWQEWQKIGQEIKPDWAGLHLVLGVALVSRLLHSWIPESFFKNAISEVLVAVLLGIYLRNWILCPSGARMDPKIAGGVTFAIHRLLRFGIILLGLRLSLQDVAATGLNALALVIICLTVALALAALVGRMFSIPPRLATLIGVGTAICGNSAIVATAPVIEAKEEEVSFAVATITLFGLLAVLLYPLIGQLAHFTDRTFGLWAGTAINDTSQVVAAGSAFSEAALNIATVVKLTRNTLMAPIIILIGLYYNRAATQKNDPTSTEASRFSFTKLVPGFVIGFLLMSLIRTLGIALAILPQDISAPGDLTAAATVLKTVDAIAKFVILMALGAVGLNTNLESMRRIGLKPLLVGAGVAVVLSLTSLSLILLSPLGQ